MFGSIGMPELIIILVIALIIFGPRKLPELGKSLGTQHQRVQARVQRPAEHPRAGNQARGAEGAGERARQARHAEPSADSRRRGAAVSRSADHQPVRFAALDQPDGAGARSPAPSRVETDELETRSGDAARPLAVCRRTPKTRGAARRADDVPRAPRRTAQAHHPRGRRAAGRIPDRVRLHRTDLGLRLPAADRGHPRRHKFIYTEPGEAFFLYIKIAAIAGLLIASPYVMCRSGCSSRRACTRTKRAGDSLCVLRPALFISGAAFSHYVLFPLAWRFFASFSQRVHRVHPARSSRSSTSTCG